jgi:hypothetical protein
MVEVVALVWVRLVDAAEAVRVASDDDAADTFQAFAPLRAFRYTVYAVSAASAAPVHEAFETVEIVTGVAASVGEKSQ